VQASSNQGWAESYTHDRYGNLTNKAGQSIGVDQTTNRLIGVGYDNNGNYNGTTWQYDIENRLTKWTSNSSPDQDYGYDSGNKRVWKRHVVGSSIIEQLFFYGAGGRLGSHDIQWELVSGAWQMRLVAREQNYQHGGKLIRARTDFTTGSSQGWLTVDRLGSVVYRDGNVAKYRPYGEEYSVTANNRDKFGTYYRDDVSGLDYADQRYYGNATGRFLTPDPISPGDPSNPVSWNFYSYVGGDPINFNDPEGLDVETLKLTAGKKTCYSERFSKEISGDINKWLNSDVGTMALQVWFEFSSGTSNQFSQHMWLALANVYRNRWLLTPDGKRYQGFDPKANFKNIIYASAGHGWWNPKTKAGQESHWNANGTLKSYHRDSLIGILNSAPDSSQCGALIDSFRMSTEVYSGRAPDPTGGATFYVHYWYPRPPWNAPQPDLSNPYGFKVKPFVTYITPFTQYTTINGTAYYVSAWFYKPADSWFYAGN
jgi:RHS repeat-associated protein